MRHLSYANVTATLALFIALGGTSWAVTKLARNSVGSAQVRDGSLQPRDLAKAARGGVRGPRGAAGPAGAQGERGPSSVRIARAGPDVALPDSANQRREVRRLENLPAGAWTLKFDANATLASGAGMHAICVLSVNGDDIVTSAVVVGDAALAVREAGLPIETAVQRTSPFTVSVACHHSLDTAAGTSVTILRPQIIATQVGEVIVSP